MSRYIFETGDCDREVAIGFDTAVGYFLTVSDAASGDVLSDQDSLFTGLTGPALVEQVEELEPPEVIDCATGGQVEWQDLRLKAMLDLPF